MYVQFFVQVVTRNQTKLLLFFFRLSKRKKFEMLQNRMEAKDAGRVLLMLTSIADPRFLSRIPDLDFFPSLILDPTTTKKSKGKKLVLTFFCSYKFHKI
jgi:hypothetical protein